MLPAAEPAVAGVICGTVRDAVSLQPVPHAAVFLFDNQDHFTGLYAATGVGGAYCITSVSPGTYTLQVRVDDHIAAVVRGVVVNDATSVNVDATPRIYLDQPAPNPASAGVTFRLDAPEGADATLEVFDICGRLVKGWRGSVSMRTTIYWDMHDPHGSAVPSGVYVVRLRIGSAESVRRFVCVR